MPSAEVVELEAKLSAARQAEAAGVAETPAQSMMPGGADSAPINHPESPFEEAIQIAETEAIDILQELKSGTPIAQVADKLLDQNGLKSIVKAIGDLAGKVF